MSNLFEQLDQKVAALEPMSKPKKVKPLPVEDHTLDDIFPQLIVSPDQGKSRYIVKQQIKKSIGDRSTPKRTWVKSLILLNLTGKGEQIVSLNQWKQDRWSILNYQI